MGLLERLLSTNGIETGNILIRRSYHYGHPHHVNCTLPSQLSSNLGTRKATKIQAFSIVNIERDEIVKKATILVTFTSFLRRKLRKKLFLFE